jgi:ribonuclease P protein component
MIVRAHRFHGYNALRNVYGRGLTVRGPLIAIKYLANSRRNSYRAAVVVSRKVHKSAVIRGRIRRRIYEIIRGQEAFMNQPYDIVVTVFSEQLAEMPAADVSKQLIAQLVRANIVVHGIVDTMERAA